jgi:hypothetical protein
MSKAPYIPWATGPGEILRHGLNLLKKDSDTNRRLAMISIDNAVELMIKTFLGLPKRVTGINIPRKDFQEMAESFPKLLDGLETYASDRLDGIDLGTIEWYHRLRNELYHQGNGLTVERDKVEIYSQLANLLFKNLFNYELLPTTTPATESLGEFMSAWAELETALREYASQHSLTGSTPRGLIDVMRFLQGAALLDPHQRRELDNLRRIRNDIAHGAVNFHEVLTPELVQRVKYFTNLISPDE